MLFFLFITGIHYIFLTAFKFDFRIVIALNIFTGLCCSTALLSGKKKEDKFHKK